jgi:hypothetical protein
MNRILLRAVRPVVILALIGGGVATAPMAAQAGTAEITGGGAWCPSGPDVTPPGTPTNLTYTLSTGAHITLAWSPATDNRRVVGYHVFLSGRQVAAVTSTTFTQIVPPPLAYTYGVRAVDAAGNLSPFAILPFGYPADTVLPAPPTGVRLSTPSGSLLQIDWAAGSDNVAVAGYEVSLNGAVISRTGALRAFGPFHGPGSYEVRVRTIDGAGNLSVPAYGFLYGDPTPPVPTPSAQPS